MINIRFATTDDANIIMKFINVNWKENHILSRNAELFLCDHQDNTRINYVIAIDNNEIKGVLGFIKYSNEKSDVATVIWKALKNNNQPMLGIELLEFLRNSTDYRVLFSPGINAKTIGIYNYLGIYTNHLNQFVILNDNIKTYSIVKIKTKQHLEKLRFLESKKYNLKELNRNQLDFNFDGYKDYIPHKDKDYFIKRYYNYPIYEYKVYGIYKETSISSVLVTREVIVGHSKVLRIMDYLGDENDIVYVSKYLYQIVVDNDYECIDFMCFGFEETNLKKGCFTKVDYESQNLIVPNYFSPFIQKNIRINFMADTKATDKIRICKADGDQDRPT